MIGSIRLIVFVGIWPYISLIRAPIQSHSAWFACFVLFDLLWLTSRICWMLGWEGRWIGAGLRSKRRLVVRSTNRSRETQGQRNQRRRDRKRALEACFNVLGICMGSRCYLMSIYTTSIPLIVLSLTVAIGIDCELSAKRCFALQDTPKSPQDCLPSTIVFHTFAPLQCLLWQVLFYFMAWASMLPRPFVRGPPLKPCLFLCFLAFVLRFGFSCSGFFAGLFPERRQEGFSCRWPAGLLHGPCEHSFCFVVMVALVFVVAFPFAFSFACCSNVHGRWASL